MIDCNQNRDPRKLIREGTNQDQRYSSALNPTHAPVHERTAAHEMVFAKRYAEFLKYYNSQNIAAGNWLPFFQKDVSAQLAVAAVQDISFYQSHIQAHYNFLNNRDNETDEEGLKDNLGYLFSAAATLAEQLDRLKEELPEHISLKRSLQNRICSRLAPAFKKLLLYYRDGLHPDPPSPPDAPYHNEVKASVAIMGVQSSFQEIRVGNLSRDWITAETTTHWGTYVTQLEDLADYPPTGIYGSGTTLFERINHIATHHLFTSLLDLFLKAYAHTVQEAKQALEATIRNWDKHEPHYALFLTFLQLFEHARTEMNTLTGRHLDFYYREILRFKEKPAEPGRAHLLVELAKHATAHQFNTGESFKAGKDDLSKAVYFTNTREVVVNRAQVTELKSVYRHSDDGGRSLPSTLDDIGRVFASPIADSADGKGGELVSAEKSWHPFSNKVYQDGFLSHIEMPEAQIGFAIASHYLLLAEGKRTITLEITVNNTDAVISTTAPGYASELTCLLTTPKGWLEITPESFNRTNANTLTIVIPVTGDQEAITPYDSKTHGYSFTTALPLLLVKLKHTASPFIYHLFQDTEATDFTITVAVNGLKTLAVSNDFGPVDTSKPFLPFGASPLGGSSCIIGSRELFQKNLDTASVDLEWLVTPDPYPSGTKVYATIDFLEAGKWIPSDIARFDLKSTASIELTSNLETSVIEKPDLQANEWYHTALKHGFLRISLDNDFGQTAYQTALLEYIAAPATNSLPTPQPAGPSIRGITMDYTASQAIRLDSAAPELYEDRMASFFHLGPFGHAEQHPFIKHNVPDTQPAIPDSTIYLFPQLKHPNTKDPQYPKGYPIVHEAEFYIGIQDLSPPQNINLLFQVVDGTADPLTEKPDPHIHWSYLRDNEWIPFAEKEIVDLTGGLINSGIISFSIPRDASNRNTLLPENNHWIRGAVASRSSAVCQMLSVAAQAIEVHFTNRDNDPDFLSGSLPPGSINKLAAPTAAVKKISQPFGTYGGRGTETTKAFHTRVSERLRHKDRAIALWDYERLVLEAFPQIYRAKCLNHTHYEPDAEGTGIYRELAAGHVTLITIPKQQAGHTQNPLRPYTSLGLLKEIKTFLEGRLSCFTKLHVRNPEFEEVWVEFNLKMRDGVDKDFHTTKLQEDLTRFLSPWAFTGDGSPSFEGKVYKSVLIDFVEEQVYVDFVTDFQLWHKFRDSQGIHLAVEKDEIEASKAVSILVSVPASQQIIHEINPAGIETPGENCPCEA